jgi:tetratricopeptide (TPR) repeat protein
MVDVRAGRDGIEAPVPDDDDDSGSPKDPRGAGRAPEADEPRATDDQAGQPENRRARRAAAATSRKTGQRGDRERERQRAIETGLDASERVDDALSRATDRSFRWIKSNFNIVQWLIVGGIAFWIGSQIYGWRTDKTSAQTAGLISEAVAAELGRTGAPDEEGARDARGSVDARRIFSTDEARLEAARLGYEKVAAQRAGSPAAGLAKLGLAGVLYDQGKYEESRKLYEEVSSSELAKLDPESKGRSIEGMALCLEAKGDQDAALKRFGELENLDVPGFRELALYHQGRLLHAKGDDAGAKDRLKKVMDKLGKDQAPGPDSQNYLLESAKELLLRIDPKAVPPPSADEALRKALEQFQKKLPPGVGRTAAPVPLSP